MSDIVRRVNLLGCTAIDDQGAPIATLGALILNFHQDGSVTWDDQERFVVLRPSARSTPTAETPSE